VRRPLERAVHELPVDVVLHLVEGGVAPADRGGAAKARKRRVNCLLDAGIAVEVVHDSTIVLAREAEHPLEELPRLLMQPDPAQRVDRERSISHPHVAIIPVAIATDPLGK
jgi:hypothetical protein